MNIKLFQRINLGIEFLIAIVRDVFAIGLRFAYTAVR